MQRQIRLTVLALLVALLTAAPTAAAEGRRTYTGTLESATAVSGPYQPVPGAVSPYKPNLQQAAIQFYRAKN